MIGVVAHDAGSAEIISSYIRQNNLICNYSLSGPAVNIFELKLGPVTNIPLEELIIKSERVLCGTSLIARLEWDAIAMAEKSGKHSTAVIDHWTNYRERFVRDGIWHFPDEVWVGDETAQKLAIDLLPELKITYVENAYFIDQKKELKKLSNKKKDKTPGTKILYVTTPMRAGGQKLYNNPLHWGYTEEDALRYFLSNVNCLSNNISSIDIRTHPKEENNKYDWAYSEYNLPISTTRQQSLMEQIVECDVVAGCATMAMVVGLLAEKRVVSCIPQGGRIKPLPHQEIEKMYELLEHCKNKNT